MIPKIIRIVNPELAQIDSKIIREYLAVVEHWTAAPKQPPIETMHWMIYNSHDFYNYFVGGDGTVFCLAKPPKRSITVGENVYLQSAIKKFPNYCPTTDHRVIPHKTSPNSCVMSICSYVIDNDGNMTDATYLSLTMMTAKMIHDFAPKLSPIDDIVNHSFFTDEKQCHKLFVTKPDVFNKFKLDVKHILDIYSNDMIEEVTDYGYIVPLKLTTPYNFKKVALNKDGSIDTSVDPVDVPA